MGCSDLRHESKSIGVVFDKYEQKIKDEIFEKLQEQLTEEYAKYREEGKKLTTEEHCCPKRLCISKIHLKSGWKV